MMRPLPTGAAVNREGGGRLRASVTEKLTGLHGTAHKSIVEFRGKAGGVLHVDSPVPSDALRGARTARDRQEGRACRQKQDGEN
ncbi:hypothetical protein NDU88_000980 [Pleurodeles waltl]|uniref:Uncharacterized protein n=1 Tax=Pleurodeles waltl TaxID=8319 RepID=A0AAV7LA02_PLEWA|nr:hypothetical protein NDU88_000980 [Pleurodeles waltl]